MNHRPRIRSYPTRTQERGATLLIGLIMLVLLTLHALAAYTVGTAQLRIVGNMHERQAAQAAANDAIGLVLSSSEFVTRPAAVAATPIDVDIDGDNASEFRIAVTPTCSAAIPLRDKELDPDVPEDLQCIAGTTFGSGTLCATSHWNLRAVVAPASGTPATGVTAETNQGATVRLDSGEARTLC